MTRLHSVPLIAPVVRLALLIVPLTLFATTADASELRDGRRFDPGATMISRAAGAPEQTDQVAGLVGQWDVELAWYDGDSLASNSPATAEITFMNRGHALMERFHCPDFDGRAHALSTIAFLMYNNANSAWNMGIVNSYTENVTVYNGAFDNGPLVLETIIRRGGSVTLARYRLVFDGIGSDVFTVTATEGTYPDTGRTAWTRTYRRRPAQPDFMRASADYGSAATNLPPEARQFDFLVGEWDEQHEMTFPNGQVASWPANGTAVHALNGHAIMEFSWFDVDPNLPDAATCIVRVYNRAMRRWECMYTTNRFNSVLYFGGVGEGDRIVLHPFESDTAAGPLNYWTFHDIARDSYGWFANTSRDRGETFVKTWIIQGTRKK